MKTKKAAPKKAAKRAVSAQRQVKREAASQKGSTLDDLLVEDGLYEAATDAAIKRVVAWQLGKAIADQGITKLEMARRMKTSRAALERLLDPKNVSVTLQTLNRAAGALGKSLRIGFDDPAA